LLKDAPCSRRPTSQVERASLEMGQGSTALLATAA
jgi:hypothetical protein